jgi:NADH:ubiquinone oxidoreductase subunit 4 (subunit M)
MSENTHVQFEVGFLLVKNKISTTNLCILFSWNNIKYYLKEFLILFLFLDFFLINVFCSLDLLCFYIFFESVLIPMFLIVGIWGSLRRLTTDMFTNLIMMFVLFIFLVLLLFKLIHSNQNLYFVLLHTERVGLVTESTSNVVYFEGCNKIKKVSNC